MNYYKIKTNCIANGEGIRTAIFISGCPLDCAGCFNQEMKKYSSGKLFDDETFSLICNSMNPAIAGLSLLGGDPTAPRNIESTINLCSKFKQYFPDKTIWC